MKSIRIILLSWAFLPTVASGNKVKIWIAKDVLKELENILKVEGRERLISADSKMGKEK